MALDLAPTNRFPKITEQGLDDLRKRIGVPITDTLEPWNYAQEEKPPEYSQRTVPKPGAERVRER